MQSIFYDALQNGSLYDAFHLAGLIEWPDDEENDETPATMRYERIEDEILRRTLATLERPVAEAFIETAGSDRARAGEAEARERRAVMTSRDRLRHTVRESGLTQTVIARRAGIAPETLSES